MKTWDLSILYNGFDDPRYAEDLAALDGEAKALADFAKSAASMEKSELLVSFISNTEKISSLANKLAILISMIEIAANDQAAITASNMMIGINNTAIILYLIAKNINPARINATINPTKQ